MNLTSDFSKNTVLLYTNNSRIIKVTRKCQEFFCKNIEKLLNSAKMVQSCSLVEVAFCNFVRALLISENKNTTCDRNEGLKQNNHPVNILEC